MSDNIATEQTTKPALLEIKKSLSFYFTTEQIEELKTIVELNDIPDAKSLFAFLLSKLNSTTPDHTAEIEELKNIVENTNRLHDNNLDQLNKANNDILELRTLLEKANDKIKEKNSQLNIASKLAERLNDANLWLNNNYSRIKSFCSYIPKNF
jgi:hypothetical protein